MRCLAQGLDKRDSGDRCPALEAALPNYLSVDWYHFALLLASRLSPLAIEDLASFEFSTLVVNQKPIIRLAMSGVQKTQGKVGRIAGRCSEWTW